MTERIDKRCGKTHLTKMGTEITISSKGQIVIPKDVRDALGLRAGGKLKLERVGNRLILESSHPDRPRISYEEFRRRMPKYEGPRVSDEAMRDAIDHMFAARDCP